MSFKLGHSSLTRRTPLKRHTQLRTLALRKHADSYRQRTKPIDPAEAEWKRPRYGRCQNCQLIDDRPLHGHHVVARQALARAELPEFDPRDRMDLCERCHMNHEFGQVNRKIKVERVPVLALQFALEVFGEGGAAAYIERHYDCSVTR